MKKIISLLLCALIAIPAIPQSYDWHPWKGKRVAFFGDSITDPNNDGSKIKYWGFLQEWLSLTPYIYGISGKQWNDIPRQVDQLKAEHGNDVDAILIFIGTNDYNDAVPIGEWYEEIEDSVVAARHEPARTVLRKKRVPSKDADTYRGRINIALEYVKENYPDKQVVLLTPIHRAYFHGGNSNIQPSEDYQNACGEYVDAYVESVREAGRNWSIPVIDIYEKCGLYPLMDACVGYFHDKNRDRLHPNDEGHKRLAYTLLYQLGALPCSFTEE